MTDTHKWYDVHLPHFQEIAYVKNREEYERLYRQSISDPESFWDEQARKYLTWEKEWETIERPAEIQGR